MDYTSEKCAGCGVKFSEGDDVVVCPECGSPHHRSCFMSAGECAHAAQHGSYIWTPEAKPKTEIIPVVLDLGFKPSEPADFGIPPEESIFGVSADQAVCFINSNVSYYLPHFMLIKETGRNGFNPLCFIYPAGFFASRRMWFWAIVSVIINLILAVPSMITLLTDLNGESLLMSEAVNSFVYDNRRFVENLNDAGNALYLAVCIIFALTANRLYLNFMVRTVRRLKKQSGARLTRGQLRRAGGIRFTNIIYISAAFLIAAAFLAFTVMIVLERLAQ